MKKLIFSLVLCLILLVSGVLGFCQVIGYTKEGGVFRDTNVEVYCPDLDEKVFTGTTNGYFGVNFGGIFDNCESCGDFIYMNAINASLKLFGNENVSAFGNQLMKNISLEKSKEIGKFKIIKPRKSIFNDSKVYFNISADEDMDKIMYLDLNERRLRNKSLCSRCSEYGFKRSRYKRFKDGEHNLVFYAVGFDESVYLNEAEFFVDNRKPRISRLGPLRGYADGNFYVKYSEDNCEKIVFRINEGYVKKMSCDSGRNVEALVFKDLSSYEGQEINYSFTVVDISGKKDFRKVRELKVDTIPVNFDSVGVRVEGRYVYFEVELDEKARYLKYNDSFDRRPRERNLCSRCEEYGISRVKKKRFAKGQHNLTLITYDNAGNKAMAEVKFDID